MKYLLHRCLALLLAMLVLVSVLPEIALAAPAVPAPAVELGTFSGDMLAGGGRMVLTDDGLFYIGDEDGYIYNTAYGSKPVYAAQAQRLNYRDGKLYFAHPEENRFDLICYEPATGRQTVLLDNFSGTVGQFYLVGEDTLCFLSGNAVWSMQIGEDIPRMLLYRQDLWSFVPTGLGLIYAVGTVFDYDLYAGDVLVAEHADNYYVDFDLRGGILIYSVEGVTYELPIADCFAGELSPAAFRGKGGDWQIESLSFFRDDGDQPDPEAEYAAAMAMEEQIGDILGQEENLPDTPEPAQPGEEQPDPSQQPAAEEPETPEEPAQPSQPTQPEEPAEPSQPEEPAEPSQPEEPASHAQSEEASDPVGPAYVPEEKDLGLLTGLPFEIEQFPAQDAAPEGETPLRRPVTPSMENIIKRARQMLNIQWTPLKDVRCWKYWQNGFTYKAGVTYKGLPYGQPVNGSYVPWSTSLTSFIAQVGNPDSRFYTATAGYNGTVGPYYAVDCSAFVSWAWNLPGRCTTTSIKKYGTQISSNSVSDIQLGDMLVRSDHVVMVTDVTYDDQGTITGVEISESTPVASYNCCCRSIWYRGTSGLASLRSKYMGSGYVLYRRRADLADAVYTHECVVPLPGDECPVCGEGMFLKPGVDVAQWHGEIEWSRASRYVDFAIIRLGGSTVKNGVLTTVLDDRFLANVTGCVENELPYGLYYESKAATPEEAKLEAEFVVSALFQLYQQGIAFPSLPVFYGVGDSGTILAQSDSNLLSSVTSFCQSMEDVGLMSGIYATTAVWNSRLTAAAYNSWYHWVVQWGASCTATPGAHLWQFSATGSVPGVEGTLNLNYWFNGVGRRDHRYRTETTAATCTESGSLGYVCVDCGQTVTRTLAALGHSWSSGVRTLEPTCLEQGTTTFTCNRCGDTRTEPIDPLGHSFDANDLCTRCGYHRSFTERFTDVEEGKYYFEPVRWAYYHDPQITGGVDDSHFGPARTCTREQIVTFLWKAKGAPEPTVTENPFTDVIAGKYYEKAVLWAVENHITDGTSPTTFGVGKSCTRAQIVTFLYKALAGNE